MFQAIVVSNGAFVKSFPVNIIKFMAITVKYDTFVEVLLLGCIIMFSRVNLIFNLHVSGKKPLQKWVPKVF